MWVGVNCVGGASATYARICLIAFYFKLFLSHLFNLANISRITVWTVVLEIGEQNVNSEKLQ